LTEEQNKHEQAQISALPGMSYICLTAALGGLLFGFDTAVISGTISFVKSQYSLSAAAEGWFVSSGLLGCVFGVVLAGFLTDRFGRKFVLIASALMFLVCSFGCAFAPTFDLLVLARGLGGVGVGMASVVAPMYIAEFAPATRRGRMVAYYQLAITVGILLAYFSNALLLSFSQSEMAQSQALNWFFSKEPWRPMLLAMGIPSAVFAIMLQRIPESPRWLYAVNKQEQARDILIAVKGTAEAENDIAMIAKAEAKNSMDERSLLDKSLRLPLIIGVMLGIFSQFTGINAIIYYGPRIFESAGFASGNAFLFQVIIGVINVVFTFVAITSADKYGRRTLLLGGLAGIILSLVICALLFYSGQSSSLLLLGMIVFFIACFALSVGPCTWILINEIFPTDVRAKAVSLCTFMVWAAVWVVGQFFPWMVETVGPAVTFATFAIMSLGNFLFCWKIVRETKNIALEDMEQLFVAPH
jgi:SP family arabinose:H+ symporter-like MFS transporter